MNLPTAFRSKLRANAPTCRDICYLQDHYSSIPIWKIAKNRRLRYSQVKYYLNKLGLLTDSIRVRAPQKSRRINATEMPPLNFSTPPPEYFDADAFFRSYSDKFETQENIPSFLFREGFRTQGM